MPNTVRCGLVQTANDVVPPADAKDKSLLAKIKDSMLEKHLKYIDDAAKQGAQVLCLQELFYGPYFCQIEDRKGYAYTEKIPEGPTTKAMQERA